MLPKPEDVYQTEEQAREVLADVAAKLKAGEWRFTVPNTALEVVRASLDAAGWDAITAPGVATAIVAVFPRSKKHQAGAEALDAFEKMLGKARN